MNTKAIVSALLAEKQAHQNAVREIDIALTALRGFVWSASRPDAPAKSAVKTAPRAKAKKAHANKRCATGIQPEAVNKTLLAHNGQMERPTLLSVVHQTILADHGKRIPMRKINKTLSNMLRKGLLVRTVNADGLSVYAFPTQN